jgi:hypothetical protein
MASYGRWRAVFGGLVLSCAFVLSGGVAAAGKDPAQLPQAFAPEVMYLQPSPYERLYVKVDRVEGTTVDARWLADLKDFLAAHCRKPGGIQMAQGAPIPLAAARGLSPSEIAGMRIEGPPAGAVRTAYLYVLFYDSSKLGRRRPDNPHVSYGDYPCAIYYDIAYARKEQAYFAANALRHEAGHALGLCKDRSHGDGAHCSNRSCLMYWTFELRRGWSRSPPARKQLCSDCLRDLRQTRVSRPDGRFFFAGPVLVRQEKSYWVLSYPGVVGLAFDKRHAMDWRGLVRNYRAWIRTQGKSTDGSICAIWQLEARGRERIAHLKRAIEQARNDPSPLVQDTARQVQRQLRRGLERKPMKTAASLERQRAAASMCTGD